MSATGLTRHPIGDYWSAFCRHASCCDCAIRLSSHGGFRITITLGNSIRGEAATYG